MTAHWTLDDIPWHAFDATLADPKVIATVKAAALVEVNAADYVDYLKKVFDGHPETMATIERWGVEEIQHGKALAAWALKADPTFDFDRALARFRAQYRLPDVDQSVRGSRPAELVARCVVESGTSSLYTAMRDSTEEPALKAIAGHIAADEFRHYKLFLDTIPPFSGQEPLSRWARLKIALGRIIEVEDDELASAWWAANTPEGTPFDRDRYTRLQQAGVVRLYRRRHTDRAIGMVAKACGLNPHGLVSRLGGWIFWQVLRVRNRQLLAAG